MGRVLLTEKFLAAAKTTAAEYADAQVRGLTLRVLPSGVKTWSLRYRCPRDGTRARLNLGSYPATSLAAARGKALAAKALAADGQDPGLDVAGTMTVAMLITSYIAKHARPQLRSHAELERRLRKNVEPVIGAIKLGELHRRDITRVIDPVLARGRPIEACRVFEDTRAMLRWAVARGDLDHSPAEGMRKPAEARRRERVLSEEEIAALWQVLPTALARSITVQRILKLVLITGQRVGEVAGMTRAELDLAANVWTIEPARTKNGARHRVPLSGMARAIIDAALADIAADCPFVFPAENGSTKNMVVAKTLQRALGRLGLAPFTSHDLRRTMLTELGRLGVAPIVRGHIANHRSVTRAGVTLGVYDQHSYAAEKAQAMELWGERLAAIIAGGGTTTVVPLARRNA